MKHFDVLVVGGGVVGLSAAYGMCKEHHSIGVLDEGDGAYRASRSNFGLVWFQGKGVGAPEYSSLSKQATQYWPNFSNTLESVAGRKVDYKKSGGLNLCIGVEAAEKRKMAIEQLRNESETGSYDCEFLDRIELEDIFGNLKLGDAVQTATYSSEDGHVNPLFLMHALHKAFLALGGTYIGNSRVIDIRPIPGGGFEVVTDKEKIGCTKLLLAAGLSLKTLGQKVGLDIPIHPERGQILVTQRAEKLFPLPMSGFRQSVEGSILLGYSNEDIINDHTSVDVTTTIANKAVTVFPQLAKLRLVRTWAGLRVLSPDHNPIYAESKTYPGAYAATCHSGITLASIHEQILPDWILSGKKHEAIEAFSVERFYV